MIRDALALIADSYLEATEQPLKDNPVADLIRNVAPIELRNAIENDDFVVEGSPGQGNWADVPWLAVFNPTITTSATRGYYVVYLFSANMDAVYLCLGQGTTSVREEFKSQTHEELRRLGSLMRARLPEAKKRFSSSPIELGGRTRLALDYEPAVALSIRYDLNALPQEDALRSDLREVLSLYSKLVARGGRDNFEDISGADAIETEGATIEERRRYRQHRKIERSPKAAKRAKEVHGTVCQGCSIDFGIVYGPVGNGYIEAHHLTPLSELPEDVPVSLDPKTDFAVLCANCHRMVHRKNGPRTVEALRELPGITLLRQLHDGLTKSQAMGSGTATRKT